jgi:hypothetical protein
MLVLPGPGLLTLGLGIIILGSDDPGLRSLGVRFRMAIRRLCHARSPLVRAFGMWLRQHIRQTRKIIGEQLRRHARGEPLSPMVRLWIILTAMFALAGAGLGFYMILS